MTSTRRVVLGLAAAALLGLPGTAAARAGEDQRAPASGTLVLEPIRSGPVIAPDVKVTEIDGSTEVLFGVWGGYLHDETWLFGAAGYWLIDGPAALEMSYGGFLAGWRAPAFGPVRFGVRGLLGGGWATVPVAVGWPTPYDRSSPASARHGHWPGPGYRVWYSDGFFVAEPQADVVVHIAPWLSLTGGVSYRWVDGDDLVEDRLRGVAGSVALQFGVF